jgi:hypothetical protein
MINIKTVSMKAYGELLIKVTRALRKPAYFLQAYKELFRHMSGELFKKKFPRVPLKN